MKTYVFLTVMLLASLVPGFAQSPAMCGQASSPWMEINGNTPGSAIVPAGTTYMLGSSGTCTVATTATTLDLSTNNLFILRTANAQTIPTSTGTIIVPSVLPWNSDASYSAGDVVLYGGSYWSAVASNTGITPASGPSWEPQPALPPGL